MKVYYYEKIGVSFMIPVLCGLGCVAVLFGVYKYHKWYKDTYNTKSDWHCL